MGAQKVFSVMSGEVFEVTATSPEEALAKFYVAQGYEELSEYDDYGYDFTTVNDDVEFVEVDTVVTYAGSAE